MNNFIPRRALLFLRRPSWPWLIAIAFAHEILRDTFVQLMLGAVTGTVA